MNPKRYFSKIKMVNYGLFPLVLLLTALVFTVSSSLAFTFDVKDTSVNIGGYAKFLMMYDIDGTGGDMLTMYSIPLDDASLGDTNDFRMTARESRLFVKTKTNSEMGLLQTHVEGDFHGDGGTETWSNSRTFRMRHAYGKITRGKHTFLAGQTWSTFMDLAAMTPRLDLVSDPGASFIRQAMLQYQYEFAQGNNLTLAIENPDRGATYGGTLVNIGTSEEKMPDFIAKYWYSGSWGHISPKALIRMFDIDGETAMGWGVSLTGHLNIGKGHRLYAGALYGDGIGRYGGVGVISGAGLTINNEIETIKFWGAYTGATFSLSDTVKWTIGVGYSENDEDDYTASNAVLTGNAHKEGMTLQSNIKWSPYKDWELALGFVNADREVMDGREGEQTRIQSYIKYTF
ncbi:DcaP family trimeric outer membrane transporter [Desulfocicer niacini]